MNTYGILVLSFWLLYVGRGWREFFLVTLFVVIVGGLFVWAVARDAYHCGASLFLFGHMTYLISIPVWEQPVAQTPGVGFVLGQFGFVHGIFQFPGRYLAPLDGRGRYNLLFGGQSDKVGFMLPHGR